MAKEIEPKKEEKKDRYAISEVPTETKPFIVDTETNTVYNELEILLKILNDIESIKKNIVTQ